MPLGGLCCLIPKPRKFYCKVLHGPLMLTSFNSFSGLLRKKRSGVWRKKISRVTDLCFQKCSELGREKRLKKKRKEEKDEVVDQEIRKEICQCRIFPPGLLTRDTARAVAGSDHPVRSMGWKRHRELTRIYEDPYKMPSTACIWILVCRQVMFLFPTQAP